MNLEDPRSMKDPWEALHWKGCHTVAFARRFREMVDETMQDEEELLVLEYVQILRQLARKIADQHIRCQSEIMLAIAIKDLGNAALAREQFDKAGRLCDCCSCQAMLADKLAKAELSWGHQHSSLRFHNKAVQLASSCTGIHVDLHCEILVSRAALLRFMDHYDQALVDLEAAVRLVHKSTPFRILESIILNALFLAAELPYAEVDRAFTISRTMRASLKGTDAKWSKRMLFYLRWAFGLLHWRKGNASKAAEFLESARNQMIKHRLDRIYASQNLAAVQADLVMIRACSPNQKLQFSHIKRELPELIDDEALLQEILAEKDKKIRKKKIILWREDVPSPFPLIMPDRYRDQEADMGVGRSAGGGQHP